MINIGVDQGNCGTIGKVPKRSTNDLDHRSNAGTSRNQAKVTDEVGGIEEIALWSLDTKIATNLQVSDVTRDIAFFIGLKCRG